MNNKIRIFTAIICTAIPLMANAQENLKAAFDKFINDKSTSSYVKLNVYSHNKDDNNKSQNFCYNYNFIMPMNMKKHIEAVSEAFRKDIDHAYNIMIKEAGSNSDETITVGYGNTDDYKRVQFGVYKDRNYMVMLVRDNMESIKRYCYALTWYVDNNKDKLCGSLFKIYGDDPKKTNKSNVIVVDSSNGKTRNITYSNNTIKGTTVYTDSVTSDVEFLNQFGYLRTTYKKYTKKDVEKNEVMLIGLSNKLLRLCKTYSNTLSRSEKDFCIESLKDLQKITVDKYCAGILTEAASCLKD